MISFKIKQTKFIGIHIFEYTNNNNNIHIMWIAKVMYTILIPYIMYTKMNTGMCTEFIDIHISEYIIIIYEHR